jgi:hypothetical protein
VPFRGLGVVALAGLGFVPGGVEVDEGLHALERVLVRRAAVLGGEVDRVGFEEVGFGEGEAFGIEANAQAGAAEGGSSPSSPPSFDGSAMPCAARSLRS